MNARKKYPVGEILFFFALLAAYLAATLFLFHRQTVGYAGMYPSDMGPYREEIQGMDSGYRYPYPILFLTGRFFCCLPRRSMRWLWPPLYGMA